MKQDEIIEMARQAGLLPEKSNVVYQHSMFEIHIQRFAKLVAEKERRECAYKAYETFWKTENVKGIHLQEAILARGEA